MKILIASDSFKDSLSARDACENIRKGILKVLPEAELKLLPVADGGEGTVLTLIKATDGKLVHTSVHDPLGRKVKSFYGILGDNTTAVIEMAAASGLELLKRNERNPWITTTFGTGELIRDALDKGCRRIIIGIGGSATNDGGAGMATALGVIFLDKEGKTLSLGGGALDKLQTIDLSGLDKRIYECNILVACDVKNPLTGLNGASLMYGPQKGGDKKMIEKLDRNLVHFAEKISEYLGKDVTVIDGAGAAGGLGAGLYAFLSAELHPGFEIISDIVQLEKNVEWADLVITGEGKMDDQTLRGKAPFGVAKTAKKYNKTVIAFTGELGNNANSLYQFGFDALVPIADRKIPLEESLKRAPQLLIDASERALQLFQSGKLIRK